MVKNLTLRVLIVDDHEDLRVMLQRALTDRGYNVETAEDGSVAMRVLSTQPIDVVVTDLVMPEKEGIETIMLVRKQYPNIRILAISGGHQTRNATPYLELAARLGAHATLEKPFSIDALESKIQSILPPDLVGAQK